MYGLSVGNIINPLQSSTDDKIDLIIISVIVSLPIFEVLVKSSFLLCIDEVLILSV